MYPEFLSKGSQALLSFLYPSRCPFCGGLTRQKICPSCRQELPYIGDVYCMKCGKPIKKETDQYCPECGRRKLAFEQGHSLWLHDGLTSKGIYQLKFHNQRYYAKIFAEELARRYGGWVFQKKVEEIIPIPLHPQRYKTRGFNQASLLARELGVILQLPVADSKLLRRKNTVPQKILDKAERIDNLRQAFGVSAGEKPGRIVLLVDDIYTTGNTMHWAARALKRAGAEKVYFLTVSIGQSI